MGADVHHQKTSPLESHAIGSRIESVSIHNEGNFRDEVCLVFFLQRTRVACVVDESRKDVHPVRELNSSGIARLYVCRLSAEEDGPRQKLSSVCRMQDRILRRRYSRTRLGERDRKSYRKKKAKKT